jgi:PTS system nitrogen regulatory IIA component
MTIMATEKDSIRFSALFSPADVICQTRETERDKALWEMLRRLAGRHELGDIEKVYEMVLARENDLPTVVAPGMAMPHAKLDEIDEVLVAITTCQEGIVYDPQQSDNPVKLIVLTLAPKTAPEAYLQTIGCVAKICRDPSTADTVAGLPTPEQVWAFFDQGEVPRRPDPGQV